MTVSALAQRSTITILVVDDDGAASDLIRVNLEADGFRVRVVHDGFAALTEAVEGNIDAVITDMVMPRMDGWALCASLRSHSATARLPIIGLTIASPDRTIKLLADAIVVKPYDYLALRQVLERVLATRTQKESIE